MFSKHKPVSFWTFPLTICSGVDFPMFKGQIANVSTGNGSRIMLQQLFLLSNYGWERQLPPGRDPVVWVFFTNSLCPTLYHGIAGIYIDTWKNLILKTSSCQIPNFSLNLLSPEGFLAQLQLGRWLHRHWSHTLELFTDLCLISGLIQCWQNLNLFLASLFPSSQNVTFVCSVVLILIFRDSFQAVTRYCTRGTGPTQLIAGTCLCSLWVVMGWSQTAQVSGNFPLRQVGFVLKAAGRTIGPLCPRSVGLSLSFAVCLTFLKKSWFNFKDGSAQKVKSLLIALCPFLIYSKSRTVCKAGVTWFFLFSISPFGCQYLRKNEINHQWRL